MANVRDTLSHTKWLCKYHIVFLYLTIPTEISPQGNIRAVQGKYRQDTKTALQLQGSRDNRRSSYAGSHSYARKYTTEVQCVAIHGVSERKEQPDDFRQACESEIQIRQQAFLE